MFPPETIDHVLSFLGQDHATLKVCARAHPSLSMLVERHFYRHLTVQNFDPCPPGTYHPSELLKHIVDKPNIASYVRSLRIYSGTRFWRNTRSLESILRMVIQLQTFSVSCTTSIVWDNLCESFRTAFTTCLRLPTLTDINLSNLDHFPLSVLNHSSSLKRLSFCGYFSYCPPASPVAYPPLEFLDLRSCPRSLMKVIGSWVESRSVALRSLKLGSDLGQSSRLLGACANTLTTLYVDFPICFYNNPAIPFSLSHLPYLVQLTVRTHISFDWGIQSSLPDAMHFLDTLPSPPVNLLHLIFIVDIIIDNTSIAISDTDWLPLISFPYFDVIPRVELRVYARKLGIQIPSVELLGELEQDPRLMQLKVHPSFVINAVEERVSSWFDFGLD